MSDQQPSFLNGFQRLLEVGLILAGAISIYILITLFSFDPADPSWSKTGNYEFIKNAGGAFGAWLSDILLFTFGWLAFFIPVLVSLIGWLFFRKFHDLIEVDYLALGLRLLGFVFFVVGLSAICSMNFDDIYFYSSGGIVGDVITYLLVPLFGFTGSTLLFLVSLMMGFTLMTGISWLNVIDGIGKYTILSSVWLYNTGRDLLGVDAPKVQNQTAESGLTAESIKEKANKEQSEVEQSTVNSEDNSFEKNNKSLKQDSDKPNDSNAINPSTKEEQRSLLAQFFAKADDSEDLSDKGSNNRKDHVEASSFNEVSEKDNTDGAQFNDLRDSQASDLVVSGPADEQGVSKEKSKTANSVSFDDDMPFEFGTTQPTNNDSPMEQVDSLSYTSIDDELTDDDIMGALEGMQSTGEPIARDTMASQKPEGQSNSGILVPEAKPEPEPITLPSLELLDRPDKVENPVSQEELDAVSRLVEEKLLDFNIQAEVVGVYPGPVITRFELDLAPGIKVSKISGLSKDLARSLSAMSVRVVEVIPGKSYIGLEIPNKHRQIVRLSEVMDSPGFEKADSPLTMVLGKDIGGKAVVVDLAKMPHLLVAGTTGSGKSVGVNTMILSLLYKSTPDEVRLIMIDPKMLELSVYEGIPHLLSEVVTDMKEAANALRWCVGEMERRYKLMSALGVRNLKGYNAKIDAAKEAGQPIRDPLWRSTDNMLEMPPELERLPAIVVVIDEFADMMMIVGKKVEELIARIAQKARAAGIHLVLATQRPSVDVITGLIKANIPTRMAFQVSSKIDSRTILDQQGAENLLGMGDMLYLPPGSGVPTRVHGAFVDDHEVHAVVNDWKSKAKPNYIKEILEGEMTEENMLPGEAAEMAEGEEVDPVFDEAVAFVTETRKVSISSIQRKLRIGYNRSARIVEQMEAMGIVSTPAANGSREVLAPKHPTEEQGELI